MSLTEEGTRFVLQDYILVCISVCLSMNMHDDMWNSSSWIVIKFGTLVHRLLFCHSLHCYCWPPQQNSTLGS